MKKNPFRTTIFALLLSTALTFPAFAGQWKHDTGGWWYEEADGSYPAGQWREIEDAWYYFDVSGYMHMGWLQEGEDWYYLDDSGKMLSNATRTIDGVSYLFGSDGRMKSAGGVQYTGTAVSKEQMEQWFYATYAIIANLNDWNKEYFKSSFGTFQSEAAARLKVAWGITDKNSAEATIQSLKLMGERRATAWDYSRAMQVLRESCLAGYYTETEQLDSMLTIALDIQGAYSSWDEFAESYLVGFRWWSGSEAEYYGRIQLYETLKFYTDCFQIDWELELQKAW